MTKRFTRPRSDARGSRKPAAVAARELCDLMLGSGYTIRPTMMRDASGAFARRFVVMRFEVHDCHTRQVTVGIGATANDAIADALRGGRR